MREDLIKRLILYGGLVSTTLSAPEKEMLDKLVEEGLVEKVVVYKPTPKLLLEYHVSEGFK